ALAGLPADASRSCDIAETHKVSADKTVFLKYYQRRLQSHWVETCILSVNLAAGERGAGTTLETLRRRVSETVSASQAALVTAPALERLLAALSERLAAQQPRQTAAERRAAEQKALWKEAQRELNRLGYYRGAVDGVWGRGSRSALAEYRRAFGGTAAPGSKPSDINSAIVAELAAAKPRPRISRPARPTAPPRCDGWEGCRALGAFHERREGVTGSEIDPERRQLRLVCAKGHAIGCRLAGFYDEGDDSTARFAKDLFQRGCALGDGLSGAYPVFWDRHAQGSTGGQTPRRPRPRLGSPQQLHRLSGPVHLSVNPSLKQP
ncbi:MAG: peptidoglycan-binding domain-containing protein, partial [Pseudomonadota bacterium]